MADEAQIRTSLQIRKVGATGKVLLEARPQPTAFKADVTGTIGPAPGAFLVSTAGTDVDLSEFTEPGLCRMMNNDDTNYVIVGAWDPETSKFYPLDEILPGETYVRRLYRDLGAEFGAGTGTTGPQTNTLRFQAVGAAVVCTVEAFER